MPEDEGELVLRDGSRITVEEYLRRQAVRGHASRIDKLIEAGVLTEQACRRVMHEAAPPALRAERGFMTHAEVDALFDVYDMAFPRGKVRVFVMEVDDV